MTDTTDFAARQRAAQERVEAFERAQKEKKEKKQAEALQKHLDQLQQKREATQKQVESFHDSFNGSNMFENVDPNDLMDGWDNNNENDNNDQEEEEKSVEANLVSDNTQKQEEIDDFEARQKAARERVEAFEKAQQAKQAEKDAEALQVRLDHIHQKQMEAMKEVEALHDSHSSMLEMLDPTDLLVMEDESQQQQQETPSSKPKPKNSTPARTKSIKQEKQEALKARLEKEEADRRARLVAITSQKERNRIERERNRERLRESQRLEQQRLAEESIQASRASMEELARIAKEQHERLMALQTRKSFQAVVATTPSEEEEENESSSPTTALRRPKRHSTYVEIKESSKPSTTTKNFDNKYKEEDLNHLSEKYQEQQQNLQDYQQRLKDAVEDVPLQPNDIDEFQKFNSNHNSLRTSTYADLQKRAKNKDPLEEELSLNYFLTLSDHSDGVCNAKAKEAAIQAFQLKMKSEGFDFEWDIEDIKEFQKFISSHHEATMIDTSMTKQQQQDYYLDGFDPTSYSSTKERQIAFLTYKEEMFAQGIELDVDLEDVEEFHKSKGKSPTFDTSRGRRQQQQQVDWDFAEAVKQFQKSRSSTTTSRSPSTKRSSSKQRQRRHTSYIDGGAAPDMDWSSAGGGRSRLGDGSDDGAAPDMDWSQSAGGGHTRRRMGDGSSVEEQSMDADESTRSNSGMNNSSKRKSSMRIPDRRTIRRQRSSSLSAMDRGGIRRVKTMEAKVPTTTKEDNDDDSEKPSYNWTSPDFDWSTFQNDNNKKRKEMRRNKTSELEEMKSRGRRATTMGIAPKRGLTRQRSSSLSDMKRGKEKDGDRSPSKRRSMRKSRTFDTTDDSSTPTPTKRGLTRQRSSSLSAMKREGRGKDQSSKEEKSRSPSKRRSMRKSRTFDDEDSSTPKRGVTRQRSSSLSDMKRGKDRSSKEDKARSPSKRRSMRKSRTFDTTIEESSEKTRSPSKRRSMRRSKTLDTTTIEDSSTLLKEKSSSSSSKRGSMRRSKTFDKASDKEGSLSPPSSPKSSAPPRRGITRQLSSSLSDLRYERDRDSSISKRGSASVRGRRSSTRDKEENDHTKSKSPSKRGRRSSTKEQNDNKDGDKENNKNTSSAGPPKRGLTRQRSSSLSELRTNRQDRSASKRKSRTSNNSVPGSSETDNGESPHAFYNWINHSKDAISRLESKKAAMEERRKKKKQQRKDQRTEQSLQQMSQEYELKMAQMKDAMEQAHMEQLASIRMELTGQLDELKGALAEQQRWREEDEARREEEEARRAQQALRDEDMAISDDSLDDLAFSEDDDIMDSSGEDIAMDGEKSGAKPDSKDDKGVPGDKNETMDDSTLLSSSMDDNGDNLEQPADTEAALTTGDDSMDTSKENAIIEDCTPESKDEEAVVTESNENEKDGKVSMAEDENAPAEAGTKEEGATTQKNASSTEDASAETTLSNGSISGPMDFNNDDTTTEKAAPESDTATLEVYAETVKEPEASIDSPTDVVIPGSSNEAIDDASAAQSTVAKKAPIPKQAPPKSSTPAGASKKQGGEPAGKKTAPAKTTQPLADASSQPATKKQATTAAKKAQPKTKKTPAGNSSPGKQVAAGVKKTQPAKKAELPVDASSPDPNKKKVAAPAAKRTSLPTKKSPINKDAPLSKKQVAGNEKVNTGKGKNTADKPAAKPSSSVKTENTEDSTPEGSTGSKEDSMAIKASPEKGKGKNTQNEKITNAKSGGKNTKGNAAPTPRRSSQVEKDKVKNVQKKPDASPAKGKPKEASKLVKDASPAGAPMDDSSEMSTSSRRRSGFLGKVVKGLMGRRGSLLGSSSKQQKDDMDESMKKQAATKKAALQTKQVKATGKKVVAENKQQAKPSSMKSPLKAIAASAGKKANPTSKESKAKNEPTAQKALASKDAKEGTKKNEGPQAKKVGNTAVGTKGKNTKDANKKSVHSDIPNPKAKKQVKNKSMPAQDSSSVSDLVRGKIREGLGPKKRAPKKMPAYMPKPAAEEPVQEDYQDSPLRVLDTYEDELINEQLRAKIAKLEQQLKDTEEEEAKELAEVVQNGRTMYEKLSKQAENVSGLPDDLSELNNVKQKNDEIIKYLKAENERRRKENNQLKKTTFELHQNTGILEKETEKTMGYLEKLEDVYYQGELDKRQRLLNTLRVFREADEMMSEELDRRSTHAETEKRLKKLYDNYMGRLLIRTDKACEDKGFIGLLCAISMGRHDDALVERSTGVKQEATSSEETKENPSMSNDTNPEREERVSVPTEEAKKDTALTSARAEPPKVMTPTEDLSHAELLTQTSKETDPIAKPLTGENRSPTATEGRPAPELQTALEEGGMKEIAPVAESILIQGAALLEELAQEPPAGE